MEPLLEFAIQVAAGLVVLLVAALFGLSPRGGAAKSEAGGASASQNDAVGSSMVPRAEEVGRSGTSTFSQSVSNALAAVYFVGAICGAAIYGIDPVRFKGWEDVVLFTVFSIFAALVGGRVWLLSRQSSRVWAVWFVFIVLIFSIAISIVEVADRAIYHVTDTPLYQVVRAIGESRVVFAWVLISIAISHFLTRLIFSRRRYSSTRVHQGE